MFEVDTWIFKKKLKQNKKICCVGFVQEKAESREARFGKFPSSPKPSEVFGFLDLLVSQTQVESVDDGQRKRAQRGKRGKQSWWEPGDWGSVRICPLSCLWMLCLLGHSLCLSTLYVYTNLNLLYVNCKSLLFFLLGFWDQAKFTPF